MTTSRSAGVTMLACAALHVGVTLAEAQGQPTVAAAAGPSEQPTTRPRGRENRAAAVAPFLGPHTVAVAHADVSRLNVEAVEQWLRDLARAVEIDPAGDGDAAKRLDESMRHLRGWLSGMKQAGGRDVYVVLDVDPGTGQAGPAATKPTPLVVVPLGRGANAEQIQRMLNPARKQKPATDAGGDALLQLHTAVVHNAVVLGRPEQIESLRRQGEAGAGGSAAGLDKALEAVDGEAARLVFVPTPPVTAALRQLAARAVGRAEAGAALGDATWLSLSELVKWCAVKVEAPPQPAITMVVRAADESAARKVSEVADQSFAGALTSKVESDRVVMSLSGEEITRLVKHWGRAAPDGVEENPQGASARRDGTPEPKQ